MFKIAIFASGAGTNAAKIIDYFSSVDDISVDLVISNKGSAGVIGIAEKNSIATLIFSRSQFVQETDKLIQILSEKSIDFLVLAGFLLKIPRELVANYEGRILNIHPSLLPLYGGKGMYGERVHQAVLEAGESKTGITIHQVNNEYDRGDIVFQKEVSVSPNETVESLKKKIQVLEHGHYPKIIEAVVRKERP